MAGAWFKNETTQPQNIVACSRITTNGVTPFTTNNKDGKCIGDNAVVAENTIKDIAYLNTIQEKGNQKANNELKIATNSTACRDKFGDDKPIEWSLAKYKDEVCQEEKTIGMIQKEDDGLYYFLYKNNNIDKKVYLNITSTSSTNNSITFNFKHIYTHLKTLNIKKIHINEAFPLNSEQFAHSPDGQNFQTNMGDIFLNNIPHSQNQNQTEYIEITDIVIPSKDFYLISK